MVTSKHFRQQISLLQQEVVKTIKTKVQHQGDGGPMLITNEAFMVVDHDKEFRVVNELHIDHLLSDDLKIPYDELLMDDLVNILEALEAGAFDGEPELSPGDIVQWDDPDYISSGRYTVQRIISDELAYITSEWGGEAEVPFEELTRVVKAERAKRVPKDFAPSDIVYWHHEVMEHRGYYRITQVKPGGEVLITPTLDANAKDRMEMEVNVKELFHT